ncbi:alpha/beta-hydrolase [Sistotremastrum suecicum HHB10207 ss-3]|uniref:Alpha/beta-hydrolase n=1 Tax=Sistotremastrum suecicum HHB10207 ss-3 TaxID=1314776 RepID=A0A166G8W4_9AGAM|nr:alpha/beta-hydrolase [Sistotremastrum suecicum HHB10207 ss-3]
MATSNTDQAFKISVSESQIHELKVKLDLIRFPDELEDAGWAYGSPLKDVQRLVAYWKSGYSWREHEKHINDTLPQFTKDISVDGFGTLNIHFVHQKSSVQNAIPLLFVHGWPGSFLEVTKILPLLTAASKQYPSFHVVALSLPGYGFSEAPKQKGFGLFQYAEVCNKLMIELGYTEYVAQGGDWGYYITRALGHKFSKNCRAVHSNMPRGSPPKFIHNQVLFLQHALVPYSEAEKAGFARSAWFLGPGFGYRQQQSTQPQTLGYSLSDSPAGLLAWIYEKLRNWTDDYRWTDDEILTWVSIYWFSRAGPAATTRIYYEVETAKERDIITKPINNIPLGFSYFPRELVVTPRSWARTLGNVVFESTHASGGHFAAHEKPTILVDDIRQMFGKGGPANHVIPHKSGFDHGLKAKL